MLPPSVPPASGPSSPPSDRLHGAESAQSTQSAQSAQSAHPDSVPPSEDGILACLGRHFPNVHPSLLLGRGDDCAVLRAGGPFCVSTDLFLEDVHFRRAYFTPEELGRKALAVNVSDLAACGARPVAFTLCLGLPGWADMAWLDTFFQGMAALAAEQRMALAGGDLSRSPGLHISLTVWGESVKSSDGPGLFLGRGGSIPGDTLFLVGSIGLARVGLEELERRGRAAMEDWPAACAAHLRPEPQVGAGLMLARAGRNARPPALMDLSDGIVRDLPRLLGLTGELGSTGHGLGANLVLPSSLLHPEVLRHAERTGRNPVHQALLGGEDYALLGSCAPDMLPALHAAIPGFRVIGTVTDGGGLICNGECLDESLDGLRGFDHFESGSRPYSPGDTGHSTPEAQAKEQSHAK